MMTHNFKYIKTFLSLCVLTSSGMLFSTQNLAAAPPSTQIAGSSATAPIQKLYDSLQAAETTGTDAEKRVAIITPAVKQAFDLNVILRRSIGLHYDQLTADERQQLLTAFQHFTVARYASTFKPGTDAVFTIDPLSQPINASSITVKTTLRGKSESDATPIDYVMQQTNNGWRITDILLNAQISQVAAQRSDFKAVFEKSGATGLARTLNHKADDTLHE